MSAVLQSAKSAAGWKLIPLKELGIWTGGGTPSKSNSEFWTNGTIPWVSPKDMKTNRITESQDQITEAAIEGSAAKLIPAKSILVVTRSGILSHTLPVAVTSLPVAVNQDLKALTPNEAVLPDYVAWALRCFARDILNSCSKQGTTVSSIETKALQAFEIPVAPLDEQRAIVAEIEKQFSRLDEAVTSLHRVKANLKRYKAAVLKAAVEGRLVKTEDELARREGRSYDTGAQHLQRILKTRRSQWQGKGNYKEPCAPDTTELPELPQGWACASLDQLTTQIADVDHKMPKAYEGGVPYVSTKDFIGENGIDFESAKRISPHDFDALCAKVCPTRGDILLSRYGTVGEVRLIETDLPFQASYSVAILKPVRGTEHGEFLATSLRSEVIQSQIKRDVRATAQPDLGLIHIRQFVLPVPPLAEQHRIMAEVDRRLSLLQESKIQINVDLKRAARLRSSILANAFSGRLGSRCIEAVQTDLFPANDGRKR